MSSIGLTMHHILTDQLFGLSCSLAPINLDDLLISVSSSSHFSQSWYFIVTSEWGYYYLNTVQQDDFDVLDVDNYYGRNSTNMHIYYIWPEQYWRLDQRDNGSVKTSDNFTGPDMLLDIVKENLRSTTKAQCLPGQRWTLKSPSGLNSMSLPSTASSPIP